MAALRIACSMHGLVWRFMDSGPGLRALPPTPLSTFAGQGRGRAFLCASTDDMEASTSSSLSQRPPQSKRKRRLDEAVAELHPEYSRNVIQSFIVQGKVLVDDRPVTKSGTGVKSGASIRLTAEVPKFVCRAGLKMEAALDAFGMKDRLEGRVALDAGLSTGGFTDCLLQNGAAHVFGVDVGFGQVHEKIRTDERLTVMEKTNLRYLRLEDLRARKPDVFEGGRCVDFVSLDVSFISTLKLIDAAESVMGSGGDMVILVKPQFEAGKEHIGAGGVCDPGVREEVVQRVLAGWADRGFGCINLIKSPVKGATSGNEEWLAHLVFGGL
jgi:23S rRNA (cytidine1920-2'-O)/16S rRNA (cytidine1409-2'-O)-methyltransferase